MKHVVTNDACMMFFDRAIEAQRSQLLTIMADAVAECRTAANQAAILTESGQAGLLRLVEIWGDFQDDLIYLKGHPSQILADVLAQIYAHLIQRAFHDSAGMAVYAELNYMMASLMLGEWFD